MPPTKRDLPKLGLLNAFRFKSKAIIYHKIEFVFASSVVLVSLILSFLISRYSPIRMPQYSEGDIARSDISAPTDILIMDDQATSARKANARAAIPPVYRYDPSVQAALVQRISETFSACRRIMESTAVRGRIVTFGRLPAEVQSSIKQEIGSFGSRIDDELLNYLVRERFSEEIQNNFISNLRQTAPLWLAEDNRSLISTTGNIQIIADSGSGKLVSIGKILDLEHARRMLHDLIDENLKAPIQIRRLASEWFGGMLSANLRFDLQTTETQKAEAADAVDPVLRQLKSGKIIVRQGDEINADQLRQIDAVRNLTPSLRSIPQFVGTNLLLILLLTILGMLLRSLSIRQWNWTKLVALCFSTVVANLVFLKILWFISESLSRNFMANPFNDSRLFLPALPFAFGAMLITLLAGDRVAQLLLIFYCPLAAQVTGAGFLDILYILAINLIGIFLVRNARQRMAIVGAGFKLSAAAAALFIAIQLAKQTPIEIGTWAFGAAMAFASGPITASLLTFVLPLCERMFLVTTEIRLSELGNLNLPLLRELVIRAPGTYNHSIAVGTLAQGAANAIGLNALFLRVASLYHDIGKLRQPQIFIENQGEGNNPHDSLPPLESVQQIRQHIPEGIRLAGEAGLPPSIIDIIPQHHGTKLLSYFYDKAKQQAGADNSTVREEEYRHLGPKPQTKEAAVVMLADAIEAAARTLSDHSQERLLSMIQKITTATIEDGQLTECDLTLSEIERITFSFLETLASFYHSRIDYPSFDFGTKTKTTERSS
jgi:cyclic-di-AMP phosphodiesterase PgpH